MNPYLFIPLGAKADLPLYLLHISCVNTVGQCLRHLNFLTQGDQIWRLEVHSFSNYNNTNKDYVIEALDHYHSTLMTSRSRVKDFKKKFKMKR